MVDTTSEDHIAAKRDTNLMERTFALAEGKLGLPLTWVEQNWGNIITEEFDEEGNTMVSGLAYAIATYKPTPLPGANLAAVTDLQIIEALTRRRAAETEGEPPAPSETAI